VTWWLSLEFPLQNFADERGVGFAFAQFHHLAFQKIQRKQQIKTEINSAWNSRNNA
jgi:hypothetical protein